MHEPGEELLTTFETIPEEQGIPLSYMTKLHEGYKRWVDEMAPRMPVITVNWNHFRQVTDVWPEVLAKLEERTRFTRSLCLP